MGRRSLKKRRKSSMENTNRDQFLLISAEKIAGNEDLLSEILLRLPVRSLVRFKCVSKPWLRLISSSHFSHTHTTRNFRSLSVSGFIFSNGTCKFKFVGLDGARSEFAPSPELMVKSDVYIVHSCNGLMLCYSVPENEFYPRDYFVCNPTTKEFSSISLPHSLYDLGINLVYDPFGSPHFKVVCFTGVIDPHNRISPEPITYWTHLYSSDSQSWSSRSWSSLESPGRAFLCSADDAPLSNGVLCNGSLYWLFANQWMLLRFEVDRQCFSTIAMKVDSNLIDTRGIGDSIYLWQCKGRLCLVQEAVTFNVPADMVVYEMGNVCSQWLVKYMVKFPDEVSGLDAHENVEDGEVCTYTILAAFGGQENDYVDDTRLLVRLEYNFREPDVILYSIKEKTATKMMFSGFEEEAQPYMESLSGFTHGMRWILHL